MKIENRTPDYYKDKKYGICEMIQRFEQFFILFSLKNKKQFDDDDDD